MIRSLFDDMDEPEPPSPLAVAQAVGEQASIACSENAERQGWDAALAAAFILDWLRANGPTSGEVLVTEASRDNMPHDTRAFGSIFAKLSRSKQIESCGMIPRLKGHGAPGCRIWRIPAGGSA